MKYEYMTVDEQQDTLKAVASGLEREYFAQSINLTQAEAVGGDTEGPKAEMGRVEKRLAAVKALITNITDGS